MCGRFPPPVAAALLLLAVPWNAPKAEAGAAPVPPCAAETEPYPVYADPAAPPAVMTWTDIALAGWPDCPADLAGRMNVVVVLAGSFRHAGSLDDLAARFGAVSETAGLLYWSTTDQRWRELVADAWALDGPGSEKRRGDFTAAEVRSGMPLYFAQNDTRSTGINRYRMTALPAGEGRLTVEIVNDSTISFLLIPLFDKGGLVSLHIVKHLEDDRWTYYGLAAVREGSVEGHEKSLVNRAAAFYRFLRGVPGDAGPPLAR